ncbi:adenylate/guanylate cyclase domain-containing protein (plasmid) [Rhizobium sp. CB3171]|uniref:adenylate/guanylate cyclase domain-containing protein n=1 Tax=Rhizobium sp. CB3171 TaxID=3039157 RepID=UPI0024B1E59F|nr:adenylate/guanylate cyclase domain-containing protein [Rhizobium sp. CB3171]WFU06793.1 adenylate/guanylate cyclase domain-containing protein [Rhizobium sp. CB3171]
MSVIIRTLLIATRRSDDEPLLESDSGRRIRGNELSFHSGMTGDRERFPRGGRYMTLARVGRKLAAILVADVVGYSGLVEADEAGTIAALKHLRQFFVEPLLAEHRGRIVNLMGDGLFAEFGSIVDAVACAAAMQEQVSDWQKPVSSERRIVLRIGVNLGDVVVDGEDLLGDSINVAARLEQLCPPGSVLITGSAYEQLVGKIDVHFKYVSEQKLKNIARPVKLYQMVGSSAPAKPKAPEWSPDVRKTVTVLFTDIVDSSRLGLSLDPEALRNVFTRYFGELDAIVQRHGGIVERYSGDAIMAVFGVPLHEDDALRAVRAASEMRERLAVLNKELAAGWGVRLVNRSGINTGEVIARNNMQGYLSVAGDVVNVAKRLEEAAAPNEILIGEPTHRLVRDAVIVGPSGPRELKHGETISALVVVEVLANAPGLARRFDSPFVGRQRQRALLETVFRNAVGDRTCHLVSILGDAGVGKSRLVREFENDLSEEVTVLHGSCPAYGEGITYWPLAEIIRELTRAERLDSGDQLAAAIGDQLIGEEKAGLIAERVAGAIGLGGAVQGTTEETAWAARKLFEAIAREHPLVIVVDDVHWAESTFLELIEHVAEFSRDLPILLICIARPELLDEHAGWGAGKRNATSIFLEPLSDTECRELIYNLLGRAPLPAAAESRITNAAEGNALFAEELVAMLVDDAVIRREPDGWVPVSDLAEIPVPSSINALLAARLEGLPALERVILTAAAVEGSSFHRSAIRELACPVLDTLDNSLLALVRRDLIRPETPTFAGEKAYRFRHVLIRDAAYRSLPKNSRADLHERFAAWLELTAADRLREFEEFVGYHLEQAFQYRISLGPRDVHATSLAARASERLEAAGRRALVRGDLPTAIGLLDRVSRMLPTDDSHRIALLGELSGALIESGRLEDAGDMLDEAERLAAIAEEQRLVARILVQRQFLQLLRGEEGAVEKATQAVASAIPVFERLEDNLGLCRARRLEAWLCFNGARGEAAAAAWERAATHARRASDQHEYYEILTWIASSLWFGPTPASEGIRRCEAMRSEVCESPQSEAAILRQLACLNAIVGRFAEARALIAMSNATYADLGLTLYVASSEHEAVVELLAGNPAAAEKSAHAAYHALEEMGERAFRSTMAASLAVIVLEQGRDEEAEEFARLSSQLASSGDLVTQVRWRRVSARVLARRADIHAAEALAREALAIAESTDFVNDHADALVDLSHVLETSGRRDDAVAAASEARRLYELKGNVVAAAATRLRLGKLIKK